MIPMMPMLLWSVAASAEDVPPAPAAAEARTWKLDPAASVLYVLVKHDTSTTLANMAHDHTIAATGWTGTVVWNPADPTACKVDITVPVAGLVVDPPGYRERANLHGETEESDKPKILDNMWGSRQLDKDRFPSITFSSTSCSGAGPVVVSGNMTIHGVSRPVSLPMNITVDGDTFSAKGRLPSSTSQWGFEPFTAAMGMIKNLDELEFTIDVKGH